MSSEYAGSGNRLSPDSAPRASASMASHAPRPLTVAQDTSDTPHLISPARSNTLGPMSETSVPAQARWAIEWRGEGEALMAIEPTEAEIADAASDLAAYYNDAHNRQMMAHEGEPFTAAGVATYYRELREEGSRPFLFQRAGVLVGDGDLRNIEDRTAE